MAAHERELLLGMLERFHLIIRGGSDQSTWLCACRLVGAHSEGSAPLPNWSEYENNTKVLVSYALGFMPPTLFPRYLAMLLSQKDPHIEDMEPLRHNMLRVKLSTQGHPRGGPGRGL